MFSRVSRPGGLDFKTRDSFPLRGMISLGLEGGLFPIPFDKENSRVTRWEKFGRLRAQIELKRNFLTFEFIQFSVSTIFSNSSDTSFLFLI